MILLSPLPGGRWIRVDTGEIVDLPASADPKGPYFLVNAPSIEEILEAIENGFRVLHLPALDPVTLRSIPGGFSVGAEELAELLLTPIAEGFTVEEVSDLSSLKIQTIPEGFSIHEA